MIRRIDDDRVRGGGSRRQNGTEPGATSIPATFLRLTVAV